MNHWWQSTRFIKQHSSAPLWTFCDRSYFSECNPLRGPPAMDIEWNQSVFFFKLGWFKVLSTTGEILITHNLSTQSHVERTIWTLALKDWNLLGRETPHIFSGLADLCAVSQCVLVSKYRDVCMSPARVHLQSFSVISKASCFSTLLPLIPALHGLILVEQLLYSMGIKLLSEEIAFLFNYRLKRLGGETCAELMLKR